MAIPDPVATSSYVAGAVGPRPLTPTAAAPTGHGGSHGSPWGDAPMPDATAAGGPRAMPLAPDSAFDTRLLLRPAARPRVLGAVF